ncbi:dead box helicase [Colletotrichum karsti]|uniref:Dead box helicase n=1 Tax=Colletotrichum karsti TaxID=1095194 RepID=A0A9P6HX52_9PEZI|nr:dead box helicase [Colletotrichum karsti]KAF9872164.1 dead box helicase [Colletotrichum karsti]
MQLQSFMSDRASTILRSHIYSEAGVGWRSTSEIPLAEEVTREVGILPKPNNLNAAYPSKDAYLEVQYSILRHEGVEPLRKAVQEYRSAPEMTESTETCVYTEVFVRGANIIRLGVMVRVTFSAIRTRQLVNWPASQRLVPGTVVALSPISDNFKTQCIVAVVTGRYDEAIDSPVTPPPLDLEIHDPQATANTMEPDQEFVMIEARSNYFEAVRHVMEGLKQAAKSESPFDKYLFKGANSVDRPLFLPKSTSSLDVSALCESTRSRAAPLRIPTLGDVPDYAQKKAGLDGSQMLALQRMVTKELAIVQGPPGTGKTHTSMAALSVLLIMQPANIPIIITAQKNDTVDELLIRCHKLGVSFVRLGGQAKDATVSQRTLFNLRTQSRGRWRRDHFQKRLDSLKSQAKLLLQRCFPPFLQQLILPEHLHEIGLITGQQHASIMDGWSGSVDHIAGEVSKHPFGPWLGDQVLSAEPHRSIHVPLKNEVGSEGGCNSEDGGSSFSVNAKKEQLSGKPILISRWNGMKMTTDPCDDWEIRARRLLDHHQDLWDVSSRYRGTVYRHLEQRYIASTKVALGKIFEKINDVAKELKFARWQEDIDTIRKSGARIIGCTTTGLTKYRGLIAALEPRVMMIEEAAETREANVTAALFPSLQQMILVGDHMQLAPHADVLELSRPPFHLNVSLFQRLVERGVEYSSLQVQRRMAPDIRELLNAWYPLLVDHECTRSQDTVPGMGSQRLLWFDHERPESTNRYASKFNAFEAEMIVGLYSHLTTNGTEPSEITILTFYSGQKAYIENLLRHKNRSRTVLHGRTGVEGRRGFGPEVQTVDGYQGKENDVVLVSVTRSPEDRKKPGAGFLSDLRRVIVALSRPRRLLAMFGDAQNLLDSSARPIWSEALNRMKCSRASYVAVFCEEHRREIRISQPDEWEMLAGDGGCGMRCGRRMDAREAPCDRKCHR